MTTLRTSVQDYLTMRRGLGFKLHDAGVGLLDFVAFMERRRAARITMDLALEWATKSKAAQPAAWARRLSFVRGFARYRSAIDPRTQIPPASLLPYRPQRARPYIYTEQEIERLLTAARSLRPVSGLRGWTYYALFGLLSVSGLRISEALNLKLTDLDLRESLHASTLNVLSDYLRRRKRFLAGRPASHLFVSSTGNRLDLGAVHRTFYALSRQIGLRGPSASHGPRLHDFRHRFAVQTLLNWYRGRQEIETRLPILSTYLGHVHVSDTYWYLSAHPELLGQAVNRLERYWEGAS